MILASIYYDVSGSFLRTMFLGLKSCLGPETNRWILTLCWSSRLKIPDLDLFCILDFFFF